MSLSKYDPGQELSSINFSGMIGGPLSAAVEAQTQSALATVDTVKSVGFTPDTEDEITGEIIPGSPVYVTFKFPKMVAPYVPRVVGVVTDIGVEDTGTGYDPGGETVSLGSGDATADLTVNADGTIQSATVLSGGSGYSVNQVVPVTGGTGTGGTIKIKEVSETPAEPAQFEQMLLEVPLLTMMPIPYLRVDFVEVDFHAKITSMEYRTVGSKFDISGGFSYSRTNKSDVTASGTLNKIEFKATQNTTTSVSLKVNASYQKSVKEGHKIDKTYQLGVKMRASQDEMPGGMERILGILEDAIVAQPVTG